MAAVVYSATGKRKTSVARVRLMPGTGIITVNGKDVKDYFNRQTLMLMVRSPLVETGTDSRYDVIAQICTAAASPARPAPSSMVWPARWSRPILRSGPTSSAPGICPATPVWWSARRPVSEKARKRPQFSKR